MHKARLDHRRQQGIGDGERRRAPRQQDSLPASRPPSVPRRARKCHVNFALDNRPIAFGPRTAEKCQLLSFCVANQDNGNALVVPYSVQTVSGWCLRSLDRHVAQIVCVHCHRHSGLGIGNCPAPYKPSAARVRHLQGADGDRHGGGHGRHRACRRGDGGPPAHGRLPGVGCPGPGARAAQGEPGCPAAWNRQAPSDSAAGPYRCRQRQARGLVDGPVQAHRAATATSTGEAPRTTSPWPPPSLRT